MSGGRSQSGKQLVQLVEDDLGLLVRRDGFPVRAPLLVQVVIVIVVNGVLRVFLPFPHKEFAVTQQVRVCRYCPS